MSLGFGSLGEGALGELTGNAETLISVGTSPPIGVTALAPSINTGTSVDIPATTVGMIANEPIIQVGTLIDVPAATIAMSQPNPEIMRSVNLLLSAPAIIGVSGVLPIIYNGALVDQPSRQDNYVSHLGGEGDGALGEFSIGEGPEKTVYSAPRAPRFRIMVQPPMIVAGSIVDVPAATIGIQALMPEIDSRQRKLRLMAIAS